MRQFNTISKLLSILISPEEVTKLLEKHNYVNIARKFRVDDHSLVNEATLFEYI
jgi:hypothetical protein